jgi:hypothetical protein
MKSFPARHSLAPRRRRLRLDATLGAMLSLFVLAPAFSACSAGSTATTLSSGSNTTGVGGAGGGGSTATTAGTGGTGGDLLSSSSASTGGAGGGPICPPDEDGDNIPDEVEGKSKSVDTDGDGKPDYQDPDSDGDTMPDLLEGQTKFVGCNAPQDTDSDGTPDFQDMDSDNNGLPDRKEIYPDGSAYDAQKPLGDSDGDGIPDYADPDNDSDALPDAVELVDGLAVDTDGDGVPDLDDLDSDNDGIGDAYEGLADPDGDGVPAFRDTDSDGDGIPDKCEAGENHQLGDPPADHDNDGKYDSLDLDSDNDGIPDTIEDANHNCVLDLGETDPYDADTDADGASDLIEVLLGSDPRNAIQTPGSLGKYYFVLPYFDVPSPVTNSIPLKTNLNQGDVAFVVDTTATMGGEIQNLKTGLTGIIQALYGSIPDLAVGIAGHDDFPTGNYGSQGVDQPFYVAGAKGYVSTVLLDNLGAVQALNVHDGGDFPESQVAAYHRALTDQFLIWDTGLLPPTGVAANTYGSMHFRNGSLPILIGITDASFHNGRRAMSPATLHDPYSFNGTPPFPSPTIDDLATQMNAVGARFLGLSASNGVRNGGDPYEDMAYLADHVASTVSPSAFGGVKCGTGLSGTFVSPDGPPTAADPGGTCRLVFDVSKDGSGLSASVIAGVVALLKSIRLDVRVLAEPDPGPIDAVDTFIQSISVNASGGVDAAEPGFPCIPLSALAQIADIWSGPKGLSKVQDAVNESALGITPTQKICFNVVPIPNTTIPQTAGAQVFTAQLKVKAKNGNAPAELALGTPRQIAFIIPPAPQ